MATRYEGPADAEAAHVGLNGWIATFAAACRQAAADVNRFEAVCEDLLRTWRQRMDARRDSAADRVLAVLPGAPALTVSSAVALTGRSSQAFNLAMQRLVQAGILHQTTAGRRNRAFEAPEVVRAFTELERRLASPVGDIRAAPPVRPVPARPPRP